MAVVFTERELDIMAVLWEHGPSTVAEVRAKLATRRVITPSPRSSRFSRTRDTSPTSKKDGRFAFARSSGVKKRTQRVHATGRYGLCGSAESLIMHFVRDRRLTKAELERLRAVLDERIAGGAASLEVLGWSFRCQNSTLPSRVYGEPRCKLVSG